MPVHQGLLPARRVRISRACPLLMESNRCTTRVRYDIGFNHVFHFNRRFSAIKGVTPSELRRFATHRFATRVG